MKAVKVKWPCRETVWTEDHVYHISVPFTWNLESAKKTALALHRAGFRIKVGGPAVALAGWDLDAPGIEAGISHPGILQRINPLATRTTTGCPNKCQFCAVPRTEGVFKELPNWHDAPVLCDNNILAASIAHFDKVCDRLEKWGWCDFNQGLDCRLLTNHHADRLKRIGQAKCRLALDHQGVKDMWDGAFDLLRTAGIQKRLITSYVLVGFDTGPRDAWARCEWVTGHGVHACPMWFHKLDAKKANEVTAEQEALGWTDYERRRIMQWFYFHKRAVA